MKAETRKKLLKFIYENINKRVYKYIARYETMDLDNEVLLDRILIEVESQKKEWHKHGFKDAWLRYINEDIHAEIIEENFEADYRADFLNQQKQDLITNYDGDLEFNPQPKKQEDES